MSSKSMTVDPQTVQGHIGVRGKRIFLQPRYPS
jgi:hypothetical protein